MHLKKSSISLLNASERVSPLQVTKQFDATQFEYLEIQILQVGGANYNLLSP